MHLKTSLVAAAAMLSAGSAIAAPKVTTRPAYGCFRVTAASAPILDKSNKSGHVIATAAKGDTVIKAKRFCGLRGYCSVRYKSATGWVDKANVKVTACPPSTSKPVQ